MSFDPIDHLEASAQQAEDAWRRGDFLSAFQLYARTVSERLTNRGYGVDPAVELEAADFIVFDRLSDLARLFGRGEEADELLRIAIDRISAAGNDYWADLLRVKRIDLALGRKRLREAQSLLDEMLPSIGDVTRISFTEAGLKDWERRCSWRHANERDRATILVLLSFVMGRLLAALGQYGQAEAAFQNGLRHATQKADGTHAYPGPQELARQAVLPLRLALANALLEKGEIQRAADCLEQFKGRVDEQNHPAIFVQTLELEGRLNLLAGEFGGALACFRKVLTLCAQRGFLQASVAATLNLAHVLIFLNQTLDARRHLNGAREQAHRSGDLGSVARAEWLLRLAAARAQSLADGVPVAETVTEQWDLSNNDQPESPEAEPDDLARREDRSRSAFADDVNPFDLPQPDNYLVFFEERALGFHWLLGRRDFNACVDYLIQLRNTFAVTDSVLIKLRLKVLSGLLAYYQLDFEQAEKLLMAVQADLQRLALVPELWQVQRILGWCRLKTGRGAQHSQDQLAADNARLLTDMAGTLSTDDRAFFLLNKWTAEEEELAMSINRLGRLKRESARAPWYRRLRLRRQLTIQLEELLRTLDHYRDVTARRTSQSSDSRIAEGLEGAALSLGDNPSWPTAWQRWRRYKWRHATISFLILPDRVFVARLSPFKSIFAVSSATRVEVREIVRQWHEVIAQITQERERGLGKQPIETAMTEPVAIDSVASLVERSRQLAQRLSELLEMPPLLKNLSRSTRSLTLVLDDCLHGFPFAAIIHNGVYLIEHYALTFAYSDQSAPSRSGRALKALLIGASLSQNTNWPTLKFVSEELDSVEDWARRRKLTPVRLDDARATFAAPDKETILATLPQSAIAHLACHGQFTPDHPGQSGIVLRAAAEPELLSVQELSALDLSEVRHVTLSACWSADHFILPGRWVISLPETLARAGAASVLGCLWLVDDRIGTAFMAQFYRNLNKYTRAEALRRTQLACLTGNLEVSDAANAAQPIFWAGYQLYGRGDALKL